MKAYQETYLSLLRSLSVGDAWTVEDMGEGLVDSLREASRAAEQAVAQGTRLLRENLFPVLDDILSASAEELDSLLEFSGKLMTLHSQMDVGLNYRIHLALMNYARHWKDRDMLIRELYQVGMSLYQLETMLSPHHIRLYSTRMGMCFREATAYFETQYDEIEDPETRSYIHRSMGNIALSIDSSTPKGAEEKLKAVTRSIRVLSDPDVRAKTPSLPWDLFLYKSHQERTTLLSYLRSGNARAEAFAQVLESAQIINQRQQKNARERGIPLQPRWQYTYFAAQYHCGAMTLTELLDALYSLANACSDDDFSETSMYAHVSIPATWMEYAKNIPMEKRDERFATRIERMTRKMCRWIVRAPIGDNNEQLMFCIRQFLYTYIEMPGCMAFSEVLHNVFAARHPARYARMWVSGRIARELCEWAIEACPGRLAGMLGCSTAEEVVRAKGEFMDFASAAGRLCDAGMVHFFHIDALTCRGLFEEELSLLELHTYCGSELLVQRQSTQLFADIAHGHHCNYDGKGGYPLAFPLDQSPMRAMTCIVAVADALAAAADDTGSRFSPARPLDGILNELEAESGTRYAPYVTELLRPESRRQSLRASLESWSREAYQSLYRRRARAMALR